MMDSNNIGKYFYSLQKLNINYTYNVTKYAKNI